MTYFTALHRKAHVTWSGTLQVPAKPDSGVALLQATASVRCAHYLTVPFCNMACSLCAGSGNSCCLNSPNAAPPYLTACPFSRMSIDPMWSNWRRLGMPHACRATCRARQEGICSSGSVRYLMLPEHEMHSCLALQVPLQGF